MVKIHVCSTFCLVDFAFVCIFFFIKVQVLQFVVTVLSHHQTSNSAERLPYYHLTPETLDNVTVVMGTPKNLAYGVDQALSTQDNNTRHPKCSITDLG